MRRPCTDYEKEFIRNNSSNIVAGTIEVKDNKPSKNFDNVFVPLLFISAFFLMKNNANKLEMIIAVICIAIVSYVISEITFKLIVLKREKKKIIKDKDLSINGATVVFIDPKGHYIQIVEDDFKDKLGRPYKIVLPVNNTQLEIEERLISIITSDDSYFLMKINKETQNAISYYDWFDVRKAIENNNWSPDIIPHPNALKLDRNLRKIKAEEKAEFKEKYFAESKGDIFIHNISLTIASFVVTYVVGYFVYYFALMEKLFMYSLLVSSAIALIVSLILIKESKVKLNKKLEEVSYTQNVMVSRWSSHRVGKQMVPILMVFMYQGNKLVERGYEELGLKKGLAYGTIINMYTDGSKYYFI